MAVPNPEALNSVVPIQAGEFVVPPPPAPPVGFTASVLLATDAIFPVPPTNPAQSSPGVNNHPVIVFVDDEEQSIHFESAVRVGYAGGVITVNLFWAATVNAGAVEWFVAWEGQNTGGPFNLTADDFAAPLSVVQAAPGVAGELAKAALMFTPVQADNLSAGECFRIRIRRNGGVGSDTLVGDAQLLRVTLED